MATIRGLPDLQNAPSLSGKFMVDTIGGQIRVRKWPRKRPGKKSAKQQFWIDWFREANRLAKYTFALDQWSAIEYTKRSGLYPRDIIMSAMRGRLFEVIEVDGQEYVAVAVKDDVSWNLDLLTKVPFSTLFRTDGAWTGLDPGASGDVLTSQGPAAPPAWQPPQSGGGTSFIQPFAADFTRLKSAIPGTSIVDTEGGVMIKAGPMSTFRRTGYVGKALPPPPYSIKTLINMPQNPFDNYTFRGLCLQDASENNAIAILIFDTNGTSQGLQITVQNFPTWFTNSQATNVTGITFKFSGALQPAQLGLWFRIDNDGTTLTLLFSYDGVQWVVFATAPTNTGTFFPPAFAGYLFSGINSFGNYIMISPSWSIT